MKCLFLACFWLLINFLARPVFGQADFTSAGVSLSNISGYGLYWDAYRDDKVVLRPVGFIYFFQKNTGKEKQSDLNYEAGLELQHHFSRRLDRSLFFLAGGYYYYDDSKIQSQNSDWHKALHSFSSGAGLGVEKRLGKILLTFHLGLKAYFDQATIMETNKEDTKEKIWHLKEGGGLSVGFVF